MLGSRVIERGAQEKKKKVKVQTVVRGFKMLFCKK